MGVYSNGIHIVYAPFQNSGECKSAVDEWNRLNGLQATMRDEKSYDEVRIKAQKNYTFVDDNNPIINPALNFADPATSVGNVLYVLGHTVPAIPLMDATSSLLGMEIVAPGGLAAKVNTLIGSPGFRGGIKIFGCNSVSTVFGVSFGFAYSFAKELVQKYHYNHCQIFGYTASVTAHGSPYVEGFFGGRNERRGDTFEFHKLSGNKFNDHNDSEREKYTRASTVRLRIADNGILIP